jgi:ribosomal protein L17
MVLFRDNEFTKHVLKKFSEDYKYFLKDLSSLIFTTKLISCSQKADTEFKKLVDLLIAKPEKVFSESNIVRILVPLFGVLSKDRVIELFNLIKGKMAKIVNHKFGIYLIQKIMERNIDHSSIYLTILNQKEVSKVVLEKFVVQKKESIIHE